jgi:hypothetical protein
MARQDTDSQTQALLEEGAGLYEAGKLYEALACWKRVLQIEPGNEIAAEYLRFIEDNFQIGVDDFMAHHEVSSAPPPAPDVGDVSSTSAAGSVEDALGDMDWSELLEDSERVSEPPLAAPDSGLDDEDFFADLEPGSLVAEPGEEAGAWGASLDALEAPAAPVDEPTVPDQDPLAMDVSSFSRPYESTEAQLAGAVCTDGPADAGPDLTTPPSAPPVDDDLASLPGWLDLSEPGEAEGDLAPLLSPIQNTPIGIHQRDLTEMSDASIEVMLDQDFRAWEDQDLADLGMPDEGGVSAAALAALGEGALEVAPEPQPNLFSRPVRATPPSMPQASSLPSTPPNVMPSPEPGPNLFGRPFDRATPPPMPASPPSADDSLEDWGALMVASVEVVPDDDGMIRIPKQSPPTPFSGDADAGHGVPFSLPDEDSFSLVDETPIALPEESAVSAVEISESDFIELGEPADSSEWLVDHKDEAFGAVSFGDAAFGSAALNSDDFGHSEPPAANLPEIEAGLGLLGPQAATDGFDDEDELHDLPDFDLSEAPLMQASEEGDADFSPGPGIELDEDPLAMLEAAFDAFEEAPAPQRQADELDDGFDFEALSFEATPTQLPVQSTPLALAPRAASKPPSHAAPQASSRPPSHAAPRASSKPPSHAAERTARQTPPVSAKPSTPSRAATPPPAQKAPVSDLEQLLRAGMAEIDAARSVSKPEPAPEIRRLITAPSPGADFDAMMREAQRKQQAGDFSGSLELVEQVLAGQPSHREARRYLEENTTRLLSMYRSRLGRLSRAPAVKLRPQEIIWQSLDHRAGFVLAQVDGRTSYEDIIEIAGMGELEATRILARLVRHGVIG